MIKKTEYKKSSTKTKYFFSLVISSCLAFILFFILYRILFYKSAEEQLAAIEASLAIPDSENAATIYNQLFDSYTNSYLRPAILTPEIESITMSAPWSSQDYPEIANWLKQQKDLFEKLIDASKKEKCLFPISDSSQQNTNIMLARLMLFRLFSWTLIRAANNDLYEDRIDQALEKYICCIRMGRHIRQQPIAIEFMEGMAREDLGVQKIRYLIMSEDATEKNIKTIETALPQTDAQWNKDWETMLQFDNLYYRIKPGTTTSPNLLKLIKEIWLNRKNYKTIVKRVKERCLWLLADRQGTQILVALRQYKNENGKWPETLDKLKLLLSSEDILIDPQNKGSFIYKLNDDSFILYSTGLNGIDENGQKKAPADDWPIWPLPQTQNTGTKVSDPNTE